MNITQPTPEKLQIQEYLLVIKIPEDLSNKLTNEARFCNKIFE